MLTMYTFSVISQAFTLRFQVPFNDFYFHNSDLW